ncbi:transposase-like protein [Hymenobacter sp. UYAg731]
MPAELAGAVEQRRKLLRPTAGARQKVTGRERQNHCLWPVQAGRAGLQIYTEIVPDCSKKTLQAIIRGKIDVSAMVNTDGWRGYDGLVDVGFDHCFRIRHG